MQQASERVRVDPVQLQLDCVQAGAALAQREQRAVVGRTLHDHVVAGCYEMLEQERIGLHRAVGYEHTLGLDAVPVRDPCAQPGITDRGAVGSRACGVAFERTDCCVAQTHYINDVQRGRTACE